jgi:hypothetical protein
MCPHLPSLGTLQHMLTLMAALLCTTHVTLPPLSLPLPLQLFQLLCDQAAAGAPLAGALAWMWADNSYPDFDGYTLYPRTGAPSPEAAGGGVQPCVADPGSVEALAALVAFLQGLPPRPTSS